MAKPLSFNQLEKLISDIEDLLLEDLPSLQKDAWGQMRDAAIKVIEDERKYKLHTQGRNLPKLRTDGRVNKPEVEVSKPEEEASEEKK